MPALARSNLSFAPLILKGVGSVKCRRREKGSPFFSVEEKIARKKLAKTGTLAYKKQLLASALLPVHKLSHTETTVRPPLTLDSTMLILQGVGS
jgi:hypothetical protein